MNKRYKNLVSIILSLSLILLSSFSALASDIKAENNTESDMIEW